MAFGNKKLKHNRSSYVVCYKCDHPIRPIIYEDECVNCKARSETKTRTQQLIRIIPKKKAYKKKSAVHDMDE